MKTIENTVRGMHRIESDLMADSDFAPNGRIDSGLIGAAIRERLGFAQVSVCNAYHDYIAGQVARLSPDASEARMVHSALRAVLPKWRRLSAVSNPVTNTITFLCYAKNIITTE